MRATCWLTGVAIGVALACAPANEATPDSAKVGMGSASDEATARQAIESINATFADALPRGDTATIRTVYADDAILMAPGAPLARGRDAIVQTFAGMLAAMTISSAKLSTTDVIISGDMAIESGTYEMAVTPKGGKAMTDRGKYVVVLKRQADGSWKVVRDIFNSDLPPTG